MGVDSGSRRDRREAVGVALNYPRPGVSATPVPDGWCSAEAVAEVGDGVERFDRLAELLFDLEFHARAGLHAHLDDAVPELLIVTDGPLRGTCRVIERIDESLRQGVVLGTGAGNRAVAEHRSVLVLDDATGVVTAEVRTVWRPSAGYVLPGGADRQARRQRRLVDRVVEAFRGAD